MNSTSASAPTRAVDIPVRVTHRGALYELEPPSRWLVPLYAAAALDDPVAVLRDVLGRHYSRYAATEPTHAEGEALGAQVVRVLKARGIHIVGGAA